MLTPNKLEEGRRLVAKVEADLGHPLNENIIDLFFDNAEALGFTDVECLEMGNVIRSEKGLPVTEKWWT